MATDKPAAAAFYTEVVGLVAKDFMGMTTLATGDGPMDGVADIGDAPPGGHAAWLSHVVVADLDASRAKAESLGASLLMREVPIPSVGRICVIQDPVGAVISLFEPEPPKG
jgi:predicted enzyme related to lactoylglutathione lyase